ncbi:unnamed protein product [Parascedosporium putredinis]|uniref:DAGKc domain-containing protein n=1 Tax=Parascedosporium putredinis TaxID=1442378 RepID=A0A9P1M707_9PEZI|nr:unnamed protein product [Parascedosporium putredinis]CAI7989513.1 unnamed protein product [Parascedosporium putredinis]
MASTTVEMTATLNAPTPDYKLAEDTLDGEPVAAGDDIIVVDGSSTLSLGPDSLVLTKSTHAKPKRTCGIIPTSDSSNASESIPLYNVLWAELASPSTLVIDFATQQSSKNSAWETYGPAKLRKRAKVLVNPHAGPGGADKLWEHEAKPIFEAARMALDVVRTKYSGEAIEIAEKTDIDAYDTIVACSGDGLPHEIFNGLGKRPDARKALAQLAVSHIPCGSGNAMSCNLYGTHRASLAALAIVKGVPTPMDLVSITQGDRRILSFLSQSLGIVAESDLATEHLRWMGGTRFTYGFLVRLFRKMVYPCDLAVQVEIEHKDDVKEHYRRVRSYHSLDALANGVDGAGDSGRSAADETADSGSSVAAAGSSEEGLPPLKYGTVNDKLPEGWELVRYEKMGNFYCGNMAYMAPDANFFSAACVNDGLMDLVCIDGDVSPLTSIGLLLSVESGKFFENPLVSYRKIKAFRIIPRDQKDGYISIDGERVPFEPFQAEVHKGLGTVISKSGDFEAPGPRDWDNVTLADRLMA